MDIVIEKDEAYEPEFIKAPGECPSCRKSRELRLYQNNRISICGLCYVEELKLKKSLISGIKHYLLKIEKFSHMDLAYRMFSGHLSQEAATLFEGFPWLYGIEVSGYMRKFQKINPITILEILANRNSPGIEAKYRYDFRHSETTVARTFYYPTEEESRLFHARPILKFLWIVYNSEIMKRAIENPKMSRGDLMDAAYNLDLRWCLGRIVQSRRV